LAWEKKQGFKSFGTVCDEFYETIDPESFKNVEEVKAFVAKNSDKIEFYTSSDGETYVVKKDFFTNERYLINNEQACKISNKIVVFSSNDIDATRSLFMKKTPTSFITEDDDYGNNSIGSDTYRINTWISTAFYANQHKVALKVENFSRSLGIWWIKTAWTIVNFTFTTTDSQNNVNPGAFNISTYISEFNEVVAATPPIYNTDPYFLKYNCHTENKFAKKDGRSCICVADLILN
jgi:hypothetical protein